MTVLACQVRVQGRVQGVSYRISAQQEATRLGVTGWIRNEPDGGVLISAEGPRDRVEAFVEWCSKGPPMAQVSDIDTEWLGSANGFTRFEVRY